MAGMLKARTPKSQKSSFATPFRRNELMVELACQDGIDFNSQSTVGYRVLLDDGSMVSQPDNYHVTDTPQNVGLIQAQVKQTTQHHNVTLVQNSPEQIDVSDAVCPETPDRPGRASPPPIESRLLTASPHRQKRVFTVQTPNKRKMNWVVTKSPRTPRSIKAFAAMEQNCPPQPSEVSCLHDELPSAQPAKSWCDKEGESRRTNKVTVKRERHNGGDKCKAITDRTVRQKTGAKKNTSKQHVHKTAVRTGNVDIHDATHSKGSKEVAKTHPQSVYNFELSPNSIARRQKLRINMRKKAEGKRSVLRVIAKMCQELSVLRQRRRLLKHQPRTCPNGQLLDTTPHGSNILGTIAQTSQDTYRHKPQLLLSLGNSSDMSTRRFVDHTTQPLGKSNRGLTSHTEE